MAGRDALNVVMLVRFQLSQLADFLIAREAIRPDEEPVLKTGGALYALVGSSPTASAGYRSFFQSRSLAAKAPVLQTGPRWFESTRDYSFRQFGSPRYANRQSDSA